MNFVFVVHANEVLTAGAWEEIVSFILTQPKDRCHKKSYSLFLREARQEVEAGLLRRKPKQRVWRTLLPSLLQGYTQRAPPWACRGAGQRCTHGLGCTNLGHLRLRGSWGFVPWFLTAAEAKWFVTVWGDSEDAIVCSSDDCKAQAGGEKRILITKEFLVRTGLSDRHIPVCLSYQHCFG